MSHEHVKSSKRGKKTIHGNKLRIELPKARRTNVRKRRHGWRRQGLRAGWKEAAGGRRLEASILLGAKTAFLNSLYYKELSATIYVFEADKLYITGFSGCGRHSSGESTFRK